MRYDSFVRSEFFQFATISAVTIWLGACTGQPSTKEPVNPGSKITSPRILRVLSPMGAIQLDSTGCECTGAGPSGPVTVSCGESACGSDLIVYSCDAAGWTYTGQACSIGDAGICQCSGNAPGGYSVTVDCGQSACGSNLTTYTCSQAGWGYTGQACTCSCSGVGPGDVPVTVDCGQSACGSDLTTYACSPSGWLYTGQVCGGFLDAGVPPGPDAGAGLDGGACQCTGTDPGYNPVTVACGQSACGSDLLTYSCTAGGWLYTGQVCACTCSGTGPGYVPVTVYCGQSACGSDYMTYSCSSTGWSQPGLPCL